MYYEIYMDVFFLINFMMDYLLLAAVGRMLSGEFRRHRVILGALSGSLLTCIVILLPLSGVCRVILYHSLVSSSMVLVGIRAKDLREFVKAFFMLYAGGFLLGGIFSFFSQYIRTGSLFFLFAVISYEILQIIWAFWNQVRRHREFVCEALLMNAGKKVRVKGLIDTGNSLTDTMTGDPVCIVERDVVKELMRKEENIRYICFRSVGNECSELPLMKFDVLYLCGKKKKEKHDVWIGISDTKISADGTYRMLINPDIF